MIFYLSYPSREPLASGSCRCVTIIFGNQFGVPFCDNDGTIYFRPLAGIELLLCYAIPQEIILENSLRAGLNPIVDALLPVCIPFRLLSCVASPASQLGYLYDSQLLGDDSLSYNAHCYLQGKFASTVLVWQSSYCKDNATKKSILLKFSQGKTLLDAVIYSVAMRYRHHLK